MPASTTTQSLVILGATSAIATAYARLVVAQNANEVDIFLVGRTLCALDEMAADLKARGAKTVRVHVNDVAGVADPGETITAARDALGRIDEVLLAYGSLPDQARTQTDATSLEAALRENFTSVAIWTQAFATVLTEQGSGRIGVIGSVAGDRGRKSNYAYGAAKGGLERFIQGMQHALAALPNVSVTLVKPGFVITPMTAHIKGRSGPLWATPGHVAKDIRRAVIQRKRVIYTPWFWWGIMGIIRSAPAAILHKTKL